MKKLAGLFFLTLFLAQSASAAEVTIAVPSDFKVAEVLSLEKISAFTFGEGSFIVAEDITLPVTKKQPNPVLVYRVVKILPDGTKQVLLERTGQRIDYLSYYQGSVYVGTKGQIYKIAKGKLSDVVSSLPTKGDYGNGNMVFLNGSMYFTVGTATNSGIVGPDNTWLSGNPSVRDVPCSTAKLSGVNIEGDNFLTPTPEDKAVTGSFVPFNTPVNSGQYIYGMNKCNGAVLQVNLSSGSVQVYAYGLHNPKGLSVDDAGKLWVLDSGMEDRGVRPIKNGKDVLYQINQNTWYGWPDFNAGSKVEQPALFSEFPNNPPQPQAVFGLGYLKSLIVSPRAFAQNTALAQISDDKINQLTLNGKNLKDFLSVSNAKIIQYKFGPDDKLYVLVGFDNWKKTKLFAIEGPYTAVNSIVGGTSRTKSNAFRNWSLGLTLSAAAGFGFYSLRNMRYPIKPL